MMTPAPRHDHVIRITGGAQLAGDICVSGSKNAALPEMAAALLTTEPVRLNNVPRVTDTALMGEILTGLGGRVEGDGSLIIKTGFAQDSHVPDDLGRRMRATIVLLGALLGRFGKARVPRPGGDDIGARRFEQHLRGLRQMGARIEETQTEIVAEVDRLRGKRIVFDLPTVTGTETQSDADAFCPGHAATPSLHCTSNVCACNTSADCPGGGSFPASCNTGTGFCNL